MNGTVIAILLLASALNAIAVTVNWDKQTGVSKTTTTLQVRDFTWFRACMHCAFTCLLDRVFLVIVSCFAL